MSLQSHPNCQQRAQARATHVMLQAEAHPSPDDDVKAEGGRCLIVEPWKSMAIVQRPSVCAPYQGTDDHPSEKENPGPQGETEVTSNVASKVKRVRLL